MKISGGKPIGLEAYLKGIEKNEKVDSNTKKTSVETQLNEDVQFSDRAKNIKQVQQILKTTPDIRQEKIDQIKSDLDKGTYSVEGKKIADKMLKEALIDLIL